MYIQLCVYLEMLSQLLFEEYLKKNICKVFNKNTIKTTTRIANIYRTNFKAIYS